MLQRIHLAPNLIAERRISGTDENHLTVDDLEFVDARGVGCWSKLNPGLVDVLEPALMDIEQFQGRSFWRNHRDELESDRAVERAEAMGW